MKRFTLAIACLAVRNSLAPIATRTTHLALGRFDGCRTLLVVVRHVIDPGAHGVAPHQPGIEGLQKFGVTDHLI
jgi:hypothetical protein